LDPHIDEINAALERSLVDSSRVRSLGYHIVGEEDFARTGNYPTNTLTNIQYVLDWLSSYRATYGADKILLTASTEESDTTGAWGGGDVSSNEVTFLPTGHEFGHTMGGSHCNSGNSGSLQYGFPLAGYSDAGVPNEGGLTGGTMMCGNSASFFSNPDVVLTMAEINAYVAEGVLPNQDYAAVLGPDGTLRLGDENYANMAQVWRNNEGSAARNFHTVRYPDYQDDYYEKDDCVGFYGEEGYGQFFYEICKGESRQDLGELGISSVKVGRNVHVSLYSDAEWGAGSTCGGILQRLPFSSPSLKALAEHHESDSLDDLVAAAAVYDPRDRAAHNRFEGQYEFYASGELPFCFSADGESFTIQRDGAMFSSSAVIRDLDLSPPYAIEFDYRSLHEADANHADGLVVFFQKDQAAYASTEPPRESLGFIPDGSGYGVAFNIYNNQVSIRDGSFNSLESVGHDSYTAGAWVPIRVEVRSDGITVLYDGAELLSTATSITTAFSGLGFSVGTGAYSAEFSVRDVAVSAL
jgi:hypothetical protein